MLPSAVLGTLIMAVTWDCVRGPRLVSVSVPGIWQQSGFYAAEVKMPPESGLGHAV
jgi:hypothetical protein